MSSTYEKKSATKLKSNLDPSNVSSNETKNKDFNSDVSLENSLSKNLNKIESITMEGKTILETNKIPHPPSQPKSSRPTSTTARKIRFNSAVKSSQQKQSLSKEVTNKGNRLLFELFFRNSINLFHKQKCPLQQNKCQMVTMENHQTMTICKTALKHLLDSHQ